MLALLTKLHQKNHPKLFKPYYETEMFFCRKGSLQHTVFSCIKAHYYVFKVIALFSLA